MAETPKYTHPGSITNHLSRKRNLEHILRKKDSPLDAYNVTDMDTESIKKTLESLRRDDESDDQFYKRIEALYIRAQIYLAKLLLYPESKTRVLNFNFKTVNEQTIDRFIRELPGMKKKHAKDLSNLNQSAMYCAIAKIMIALDELDKPEFKMREKIFQQFIDFTKDESQIGNTPFTILSDMNDISCIKLMWEKDSKVRFACARRKRSDSILSKLIRTPEYDASQALKDLIGLMFKLPQSQIPGRLLLTLKWTIESRLSYSENSEIEIKFQNINVSDEVKKQIENLCKQCGVQLSLTTRQSNKSSSARYKSAKLVLHNFKLNEHDLPGVEFRFFPEDSREKGLAHHAIYELVRELAVLTRLFGTVSGRWLEKRSLLAVEQIYEQNKKIDKKAKSREIINDLIKEGRIKKLRIKRERGNTVTRYIA